VLVAIAIIVRFTVSDGEGEEKLVDVQQALQCLSQRQREVVAVFFAHVHNTEPIAPVITEFALANLLGGAVSPFPQKWLETWTEHFLGDQKSGSTSPNASQD
jgi:hypothetical protein